MINLLLTAYAARILTKVELAISALVDILYFIFLLAEMGFLAVARQQAPSELVASQDHNRAIGLVKTAMFYPIILVLLMAPLIFTHLVFANVRTLVQT